MTWQVILSTRAEKQINRLSVNVKTRLFYLLAEIEQTGPIRGNWPNYGKLDETLHHCHIRKGKPRFVAVWEVVDKKINLIEVRYVGTHEGARY
ncbi:MAG: cytotoxic translational repressor of toxin-antitoxin stability system [Deltaproteobacteria bacterium]